MAALGIRLNMIGIATAAIAATGCASDQPADVGQAAQPLIGGTVPTAEADPDPSAVSLTRNNFSFCTGTLVSPQVVMTAGHCVDMLSGDPNVVVFFGVDLAGAGTRIGVRQARSHPMWTGNLENNHDIGVVLLNFPAPDDIEPAPLYMTPLTTADIGRPIHRVGFGIYDAATGDSDGRKRNGDTTITTISQQDWFMAGDESLITCNGDSGGPSYIDDGGVRHVVGVHSFGFGCETPDNGDTRVDLYAASFVLPYIEDNDPTCAEDGRCAKIGCMADPDCTPCGPDGTCTSDCALPDVDCTTQELGEICRADSQCTTDLCVFWRDDPDTHFCSKPCDGDGDCATGMSCQNVEPFGDICYYDEAPPGVVGSACEDHPDCGSYICEQGACVTECNLANNELCLDGFECSTLDGEAYYCHQLESGSGGCAIERSRGGGKAAWLVVVLFALAAIRRSRCCASP